MLMLLACSCAEVSCDRGGDVRPQAAPQRQTAAESMPRDSADAAGQDCGLKADGAWADSIVIAF